MKRFLREMVLAFLVLIAMAYGVEALINYGLRQSQTHQYREMALISSGKLETDICIFGSSRAEVHLNPNLIEAESGYSCYNLGWAGACLTTQEIIRHYYFDQNPTPTLIVQTVDLLSFGKRTALYQPERFYPYLHDPHTYQIMQMIDPAIQLARWLPLWEYTGRRDLIEMGLLESRNAYTPYSHYGRVKGYTNTGTTYTTDRIAPDWKLKVYKDDFVLGQQWLESLISQCQQREVPLILLYPPLYKDVFHYYEPGQYEQIKEILANLSEVPGVEFWDYAEADDFREKAWFMDPYHLNREGAERFSHLIGGRIQQYLSSR